MPLTILLDKPSFVMEVIQQSKTLARSRSNECTTSNVFVQPFHSKTNFVPTKLVLSCYKPSTSTTLKIISSNLLLEALESLQSTDFRLAPAPESVSRESRTHGPERARRVANANVTNKTTRIHFVTYYFIIAVSRVFRQKAFCSYQHVR
jgi:hypothetical protein